MLTLPIIAFLLINLVLNFSYSLDSTYKRYRNGFSFLINTQQQSNSLLSDSLRFQRIKYNSDYNLLSSNFESHNSLNNIIKNSRLFAHQKYVVLNSDKSSNSYTHYKGLLSEGLTDFTSVDLTDDNNSCPDHNTSKEWELPPNNEKFFDYFLKNYDEEKISNRLNWLHPMPCCISQMAALSYATDLMPPSLVSHCFNITDDTKLEDIISTKLGPYYNTMSYELFFRYQKGFYFDMNAGEVVKTDIKPLMLEKPENTPELEAEKSVPSVPLGWRTFVVLGLFNSPDPKDDPSLYWCSRPLNDGDPPPRISSGLFRYGDLFNKLASRNIVAPDGSLLYSTEKIEPGEMFTGEKGDMSVIPTGPPEEYRTINKNVYPHRFSEDGVWFKKHFENVVGTFSILQALWARLSTTMVKSTSKVIRLYRLKTRKLYENEIFSVENKLDISEYYKNRKKGPVEFNLGVMYFMTAPTLHHAVQLVCSDPMARSNLYKNLLIFEANDALKDQMTVRRETDLQNPREYMILGNYSCDDQINLLSDRMMRFIIRSNCVNSYFELKCPRKDNIADLSLPVHQLLPFKQYVKPLLRNPKIKNACLNVNSSLPIGDLSIINKFEFDEALEWAQRNPYTRAGCYDSLFVTMADEVGFYPQNSKYVLPVPVPKKMIPHGQEYVSINRDPLKILSKRMKQHSGNILTVPHDMSKIIEDIKLKKQIQNENNATKDNIKQENKEKSDRLLITVRKTVSNDFTSEKVSSIFASSVKNPTNYKLYSKGKYSVILPSDKFYICKAKLCDVQTFPFTPYTLDNLLKALDEEAYKELDRPFYAKFLKDYIYVSLPEGHFFEPQYKYDDKPFHCKEQGQFETNVSAQQMLLVDENKVKPYTGFWIKKKDFFIFKNKDHLVLAINKNKKNNKTQENNTTDNNIKQEKDNSRYDNEDEDNNEIDPNLLKRILLQDEVYMDMVRKGGVTERIDTASSYTRKDGELLCHLTPEEKLMTAFTVPPLNKPFAKFKHDDEIPYARFYDRGYPFDKNDPRYLMTFYPYEVYQIQLEFMKKLDRGLVSVKDDPMKAMIEGEFEPEITNNSLTTWEEPDKNIWDTQDSTTDDESE